MPDSPNYPNHILHVYSVNVNVDSQNELMLNNLATETKQYAIKACDAEAGQTTHIALSSLSEKRSEAGGLQSTLKLAVGARIVLTVNVDVSDGHVNGARGGVVHNVTNTQRVVTVVLIKFDSPEVGLKVFLKPISCNIQLLVLYPWVSMRLHFLPGVREGLK